MYVYVKTDSIIHELESDTGMHNSRKCKVSKKDMCDIPRRIACWDTPKIETKNRMNTKENNRQVFQNYDY